MTSGIDTNFASYLNGLRDRHLADNSPVFDVVKFDGGEVEAGNLEQISELAAQAVELLMASVPGENREEIVKKIVSPEGETDIVVSLMRAAIFQAVQGACQRVSDACKHDLLRELAIKDPLTRLNNRGAFAEALEIEMARVKRALHLSNEDLAAGKEAPSIQVSLLIIDVDYFKSVNDTHGHVVGDEVLKGLARVLKSVFTRKTDIIARYGGEEFVVLLPDASAVDAIRLAHKFREALEEQVFEGNKKFRVTASIGVSNNGGREIGEDFIRVADDQLYVVKNGGRNNVAFDGGIVAASTGDTKDKIVVKLAKSASL